MPHVSRKVRRSLSGIATEFSYSLMVVIISEPFSTFVIRTSRFFRVCGDAAPIRDAASCLSIFCHFVFYPMFWSSFPGASLAGASAASAFLPEVQSWLSTVMS